LAFLTSGLTAVKAREETSGTGLAIWAFVAVVANVHVMGLLLVGIGLAAPSELSARESGLLIPWGKFRRTPKPLLVGLLSGTVWVFASLLSGAVVISGGDSGGGGNGEEISGKVEAFPAVVAFGALTRTICTNITRIV
jgi:hypothetical protein